MTSTMTLLDTVDDAVDDAVEPSLVAAMCDTRTETIETDVGIDKLVSALLAFKAEVVTQIADWSSVSDGVVSSDPHAWDASTIARRETETELACALRIPERSAQNLIGESRALVADLPATLAALRAGEISYRHAQKVVDHALSLPVEARHPFEETMLPFASRMTVARFDARARKERERVHPDSVQTRKSAAIDNRSLSFEPARDGMAWLTAYLQSEKALALYTQATDAAMAAQSPSETRTLTQLRVDLFAELMLGPTGIIPTVHVTVPALSLLGGDQPATLEGYGPIDADTARELAKHAPSFRRILTHPETGVVLSVGRDSYAVPADLKAWLRVRDGTCRFPGCSRAARSSDIDHTDDWHNGGTTAHDNLAHLCPKHHRLKHNTAWTVQNLGNGVLRWTSPAGKTYETEPETELAARPLG